MPAILFGSISTVADTSELQREAFNQAFAQHRLSWEWDRETYLGLLDEAGGQQRIADYAESRGETVDAAAVHATKSSIFQQRVGSSGLQARPGVADAVHGARSQGLQVGLVTTTSPANVAALLGALAPALSATDFDVIVDATSVQQPKPDGASYAYALSTLGTSAAECVAIEDNVDGVQAAVAAGVTCVAFPNQNTAGHDFPAAERTVDHIDLSELQQLIASA